MQRNQQINVLQGVQIIVKNNTNLVLIANDVEYELHTGEFLPIINLYHYHCFNDYVENNKLINQKTNISYHIVELDVKSKKSVIYWMVNDINHHVIGPLTKSKIQIIIANNGNNFVVFKYRSVVLFQSLSKANQKFYSIFLGIESFLFALLLPVFILFIHVVINIHHIIIKLKKRVS